MANRVGKDGRVSRSPGPARVGVLVEAFLDEQGVGHQVRRVQVLEAWHQVVGSAIADVTNARSVADGTLFVEVRSSAWISELNMIKRDILVRLNEDRQRDSQIEKLVFVLAEG